MKRRFVKWLAAILLAVFTLMPGVSLPAQQPAPAPKAAEHLID